MEACMANAHCYPPAVCQPAWSGISSCAEAAPVFSVCELAASTPFESLALDEEVATQADPPVLAGLDECAP